MFGFENENFAHTCANVVKLGHFMDNGDYVRAFGAINYAHAWIDAAVRIGLMDGHDDDRLFTLP